MQKSTIDSIQEKLRDATNEAETLMWSEIKQIQLKVFDNKKDQIDALNYIASLITLFTTSRTALTKTHIA